MVKTLLSILVAMGFVLGTAGVTVVAALQSQPGEVLYPLRTWSIQILHRQEKTEIQTEQLRTQFQSYTHDQIGVSTPQNNVISDLCE